MAKIKTPAIEKFEKQKLARKGRAVNQSYWADAWRSLKRSPAAVVGLVVITAMILMAIFAPLIAPYGYAETDYMNMSQFPSAEHPFGTDNLGRDLLSRCIYGARYSLSIGLATMLLSLVTGGIFGLIAAYFGGRTDTIIMRVMDIFSSIPGTLMAITIVATLGTGMVQLLFAMTVSLMTMMAKVVRAAVFTVRGSEYIESSRAIGASNLRIMLRHILPNAVGHIIIYAVGTVSAGIMIIAMLSYIGLGVQPPAPEWGALLNAGKGFITSHPYMVFFPGLMIMVTVLSLNLLGNGLRDALDPRLK